MNILKLALYLVISSLLFGAFAVAEEGMYLPHQIPPQVFQQMKNMGFQLSPEDIYSTAHPSLSQAVFSFGGGTGSFVSANGLILTNHHVAFTAAQRQSSAGENIIENGFLAKNADEEIPALGYKAYILKDVKDVTAIILKGIKKTMPPKDIYTLVEDNIKALVKQEERGSQDYKCEVSNVYGGLTYYLYKYLVVRDIRIVYIPSRNIGEFGGETDNWMWPRHTGDFSFMRAYVAPSGRPADYAKTNIPFKPDRYLKFSIRDINPGDFTIIMGYPGRTRRYLLPNEVKYYTSWYYPEAIRMFKQWIDILETDAKQNKEAEIINSDYIKGLSNAYKNYQGQLEGLAKLNLPAIKLQEEKAFLEYINSDPAVKQKYGNILDQMTALANEEYALVAKTVLLDFVRESSRLLDSALLLNKWNIEKQKKDLKREPGYLDRDIPDMKLQLELLQKSLYVPSEKKALAFFIHEALNLPIDSRSQTLSALIKDKSEKGITGFVESLYASTKLADQEYRMKLFNASQKDLAKLNDSMINFAIELQKELDKMKESDDTISGKKLLIKPVYMEALIDWKKGNMYPDANRTLRINYGTVQGYSPKDSIIYLPQTTLKGVIEKDAGEWPFNVPEKEKELYKNKDFGDYADPDLHMVPVDFLSNNYCTGGNSGSPTLNKYGEVTGLVFDINYESVTSDYYYVPEITRTLSVDTRYILFVTDKVDHAANVLHELEIVK